MHLMILDKNETLKQEREKLLEESLELMNAITSYDIENTIEETLDVMQVCIGILDTLQKEENIDLEKELNKHNSKLLGRGWKSKGKINIKINS
ncbi:MazG nucleotide pyrophosphohydrolase domain-containing protein [Clostridium botulinum]|uniref:Nucleotide pyrophosphohydrolase n=1 Tax=Clostridium botulinum TaxID=1491 RepID=A0A6G4EDA1_CLOBO|nr:MazG nucleotide pyrophosphohydrolase domain-containing protein [Clostridium botulinum]AUM91536.1 nucleotide pyrophosphohydrolase [Clostridium botulinum]NFB12937.1 nucleotide pyrophosphohydrolase [Clostridium botulinum]NFH57867.1 nucleotide pyrophosphohydrolase [Clostridium botulinum]NFH61170.1 nucleotide pyrophosphohydrolase [Clostridium botulinum]NFJ87260.1 nucleotide pyrophosphohydrolase [Clostridium botulinum]